MNKQIRYSLNVRERTVHLVYENQGDYGYQVGCDGIDSIEDRFTPETLRT